MLDAIILKQEDDNPVLFLYADDTVTKYTVEYYIKYNDYLFLSTDRGHLHIMENSVKITGTTYPLARYKTLEPLKEDIVNMMNDRYRFTEENFYIDPIFNYITIDLGDERAEGIYTFENDILKVDGYPVHIFNHKLMVEDGDGFVNKPMDTKAILLRLMFKYYEVNDSYLTVHLKDSNTHLLEINGTIKERILYTYKDEDSRIVVTKNFNLNISKDRTWVLHKPTDAYLVTHNGPITKITFKTKVMAFINRLIERFRYER